MIFVFVYLCLLTSVVNGDCYNAEYGLTGLGDDEDTCYVILDNNEVSAGYVDDDVEKQLEDKEIIPCYLVEKMFKKEKKPFVCNCTGMICNGHALMEARHSIGLMEDKSPDGRYWRR